MWTCDIGTIHEIINDRLFIITNVQWLTKQGCHLSCTSSQSHPITITFGSVDGIIWGWLTLLRYNVISGITSVSEHCKYCWFTNFNNWAKVWYKNWDCQPIQSYALSIYILAIFCPIIFNMLQKPVIYFKIPDSSMSSVAWEALTVNLVFWSSTIRCTSWYLQNSYHLVEMTYFPTWKWDCSLLTVAIFVASSSKRSFSNIKLIMMYLRWSMTESRLTN